MSAPEPAASEALGAPMLPVAHDAGQLSQDFTAEDLAELRHLVQTRAGQAGMAGEQLDDFVLAVHELLTNAVRHGGGRGRLELRRDGDTLLCDVADHGPGFTDGVPVASGPPPPETYGGRGLWLARSLTDTLLISDRPGGVTVSVTTCLPATAPFVDLDDILPEFADSEDDGRTGQARRVPG